MACTTTKEVFRDSYDVLLDEVNQTHQEWDATQVRQETARIFRPRHRLDKSSDTRESSGKGQYQVGKFELRNGDIYFPQYDTTLEKLHQNDSKSTIHEYSTDDHATSRALTEALRQGATDVIVVYGREGKDNRDIIRYMLNPVTGRGEIWAFNTAPDGRYHSFEDIRHIARAKFTGYTEMRPAPTSLVLTDKKILPYRASADSHDIPLVSERELHGNTYIPRIREASDISGETKKIRPNRVHKDAHHFIEQGIQIGRQRIHGNNAGGERIPLRAVRKIPELAKAKSSLPSIEKRKETEVYALRLVESSVIREWQQAADIRSVAVFAAETGVGVGAALYGVRLMTLEFPKPIRSEAETNKSSRQTKTRITWGEKKIQEIRRPEMTLPIREKVKSVEREIRIATRIKRMGKREKAEKGNVPQKPGDNRMRELIGNTENEGKRTRRKKTGQIRTHELLVKTEKREAKRTVLSEKPRRAEKQIRKQFAVEGKRIRPYGRRNTEDQKRGMESKASRTARTIENKNRKQRKRKETARKIASQRKMLTENKASIQIMTRLTQRTEREAKTERKPVSKKEKKAKNIATIRSMEHAVIAHKEKKHFVAYVSRKERKANRGRHRHKAAETNAKERQRQPQKDKKERTHRIQTVRKTHGERKIPTRTVNRPVGIRERQEKRSAQRAKAKEFRRRASTRKIESRDLLSVKTTERLRLKKYSTMRAAFALGMFMFLRDVQKKEVKRNVPQISPKKDNQTEDQRQREPSTWILLAVIWYLAAIREHGKRQVRSSTFKAPNKRGFRQNHTVPNTTGHWLQLPIQGVIFLARS